MLSHHLLADSSSRKSTFRYQFPALPSFTFSKQPILHRLMFIYEQKAFNLDSRILKWVADSSSNRVQFRNRNRFPNGCGWWWRAQREKTEKQGNLENVDDDVGLVNRVPRCHPQPHRANLLGSSSSSFTGECPLERGMPLPMGKSDLTIA